MNHSAAGTETLDALAEMGQDLEERFLDADEMAHWRDEIKARLHILTDEQREYAIKVLIESTEPADALRQLGREGDYDLATATRRKLSRHLRTG